MKNKNQPEDTSAQEKNTASVKADVSQVRLFGNIGYIFPILFFLPLVKDAKNNSFAKYHVNQQLLLLLFLMIELTSQGKKLLQRQLVHVVLAGLVLVLLLPARAPAQELIVIENAEMRLTISEGGEVMGLVHKPTGQQMLADEARVPIAAVRHDRGADHVIASMEGQQMLAHPAEPALLPANRARRSGDRLWIGFELLPHEVVVRLNITDAYIGFTVERVENAGHELEERVSAPLDEVIFLQLPVKKREHFGAWLNVVWDDEVAVNVLAADPYPRIGGEQRDGYYLLQARTVDRVKTLDVTAALITTRTDDLLDRIDQIERDYDLPRGVESRRSDAYRQSIYWGRQVTPANIDEHIRYAKAGGFRHFMISHFSFGLGPGHFEWQVSYPRGMADLRAVLQKIEDAGMIPGLHLHYNKVMKTDAYVAGGADPRLNLLRMFTLAAPIDEEATTIEVEENPRGLTRSDGRRLLQIGGELVMYEDYTTERPYRFTGCTRGMLESTPQSQPHGFKLGLLDVDSWVLWVRLDQDTSIQQEVAERIGRIWKEAGFRFVYFDGAEDVSDPYWFNVSRAQKVVWDQLDPKPLFAEGSMRSHFSWHMVTRANAYDLQQYRSERVKEMTRRFPMWQAQMLATDFTNGNFGWVENEAPGENHVGMQPDVVEYSTSRAAGWGSPTTYEGRMEELEAHPRTSDNLEVLRRWEEVRAVGWLSERQKAALRDPHQEHTLLLDEEGAFELVAYEQVADLPTEAIRAFHLRRQGDDAHYIVYWNTTGEGEIELPLAGARLEVYESFERSPKVVEAKEGRVRLPAGGRRYVKLGGVSKAEVVEAFKELEMVSL